MKWLALLLLVVGCVDEGSGPPSRVDPKYVRAHLLKELPAGVDRFDVTLGDKVVYLGNIIDRTRVVPGQMLTVKHYWKVLKPPGKNWRPFALVRGPAGSSDFMNLDATDMQVGYPVAKWQPNDIIEDEQQITMRPDWTSPSAILYVGLIAVAKHGTLDRMPVTGARTQDRAIIAAKLDIDLSRAPPPPGTIHIPRASSPIVIDGMQLDGAWQTAVTSNEFVTGEASTDPVGKATAKVTWDDQHLYLFISVVDSDITSQFTNHDDPLWKADCVEIFLDADGNQRGYIELQVSPRNTKFDSWFANTRAQPGDVTWTSNMITEVKVRGTPNAGDGDQGWDVEIGIPWAAVKGKDEQMAVSIPPRIGDRWRFNVNRVDIRSGNDRQAVSSWKRIGNDWHALDRMLTAVFADPTGSTAPSEVPAENPQQPGIMPPPPTPPTPQLVPSTPQPSTIEPSAPAGSSVTPPAAPRQGSAAAPTIRSGSAAPAGSGAPVIRSGSAAAPAGSGAAAVRPGSAAPAGSAAPQSPASGAPTIRPGSAAGSAAPAIRSGSAAPRSGSATGSGPQR